MGAIRQVSGIKARASERATSTLKVPSQLSSPTLTKILFIFSVYSLLHTKKPCLERPKKKYVHYIHKARRWRESPWNWRDSEKYPVGVRTKTRSSLKRAANSELLSHLSNPNIHFLKQIFINRNYPLLITPDQPLS